MINFKKLDLTNRDVVIETNVRIWCLVKGFTFLECDKYPYSGTRYFDGAGHLREGTHSSAPPYLTSLGAVQRVHDEFLSGWNCRISMLNGKYGKCQFWKVPYATHHKEIITTGATAAIAYADAVVQAFTMTYKELSE